jgi:hypothetical protein
MSHAMSWKILTFCYRMCVNRWTNKISTRKKDFPVIQVLPRADLLSRSVLHCNSDFQNADFQNVNLQNVNLQNVNFQNVKIQNVNLQIFNSQKVKNLQNVNLQIFNSQKVKNLQNVNLQNVNLQTVDFQNFEKNWQCRFLSPSCQPPLGVRCQKQVLCGSQVG